MNKRHEPAVAEPAAPSTAPTRSFYEVRVAHAAGVAGDQEVGYWRGVADSQGAARALARADLWDPQFSDEPAFDLRVLPRFLCCDAWQLAGGTGEVTTRWTLDRVTAKVVDADGLSGSGGTKWTSLGLADRRRLLAGIQATEADTDPKDFGVVEVDALPAWSGGLEGASRPANVPLSADQRKLLDLRVEVSEAAYRAHDFGDGVRVTEAGEWDPLAAGRVMSRDVSYSVGDEAELRKATFNVVFASYYSTAVSKVYAMNARGLIVGPATDLPKPLPPAGR
jgi:hypothetical protein